MNIIADDRYFNLFNCCLLTRGQQRSLVVDTQRGNFYFIPNDLYEILMADLDKPVSRIAAGFAPDEQAVLMEYFEFLVENELGFFTSEKLPFIPVPLEEYHEKVIENVIIDIRGELQLDLHEALAVFVQLNVKAIQFRVFESTRATLDTITEALKGKTFSFVEILMNQDTWYTVKRIRKILKLHPNLYRICLFNYREEEQRPPEAYNLQLISSPLTGKESCGAISPSYFSTNLLHYIESLNHNTCLNKKISVDENGEIKHCPSMTDSYGKFSRENLVKAINDKAFITRSAIRKDQIDICKACEFRNICTDCRAYRKVEDDLYSQPLKCNYDPYTATWNDH